MKKFILLSFFFILFLFASATAYIYFNQASYASGKVSNLFGTPATIEKVRWTRNGIVFEDVVLYNPPGCTIQTAFSVKAIEVDIGWRELFAALFNIRIAQIDKVHIQNPLFAIEFFNAAGSDSNWMRLLENGVKNYKENERASIFHVENIVLTDVDLQILNKALSLQVTHPDSIAEIQMGQVTGSFPLSASCVIHGAVKISLFEIATVLQKTEFRDSINDVPLLPPPQ